MADDRSRNFATVIYPESCPDNFIDIISDWHLPAFLSPLHDSDINANGEKKKEHYHLLVMFRGKKTRESVKELFEQINGVGCEKVLSIDGYARYLIHIDNPEKAQYKASEVREFGGACYAETIARSADENRKIFELTDLIIEKDIDNVLDAYVMCRNLDREDLNEQLTRKSTLWFSSLCKASAYKRKQMQEKAYINMLKSKKDGKSREYIKIDKETGEVINEV